MLKYIFFNSILFSVFSLILTYQHYQYKYREMVENNRLSNHRKEKNFALDHFSDFEKVYFPIYHRIFVILLKMVE